MTYPSEVYSWLSDKPVGAYVVVTNDVADQVMLTQGGMIYRNDLWHSIRWERLSPGTGTLFLVATLYKDRNGAGAFVSLSNQIRTVG